jgi:hypothetical protein
MKVLAQRGNVSRLQTNSPAEAVAWGWDFLGALQRDNSVAWIAALIATFIGNRACLKTGCAV